MDKLIRQIYNGFDRFPADLIAIDSYEYDQARELCYSYYNELVFKLPNDLKDDLEKLLESHMKLLTIGMEEGFISGFRHGVRLGTEVFSEE